MTSAKKQDMNIFVVCNDAGRNHIVAHYDSDFHTAFKACTGQTPKSLPRKWSNKIQQAGMNDKSNVTPFKCPYGHAAKSRKSLN